MIKPKRTEQDITHILTTPRFIDCSNPVPKLSVDSVSYQGNGFTFDAQLRATDGCVGGIEVESYEVFWEVTYGNGQADEFPEIRTDYASGTPRNTFEVDTTDIRILYLGLSSVEISRIEIRPNHREYGGELYTITLNRRVYPSGGEGD